jgi:K+-transporting ATPase ATPase B chain
MHERRNISIFQKKILLEAFKGSFSRLNPIKLLNNPVMHHCGSRRPHCNFANHKDIFEGKSVSFDLQITIWLWFTVLFANFAEAIAESQGKARAESLKQTRSEAKAKQILDNGNITEVSALSLKKNDMS